MSAGTAAARHTVGDALRAGLPAGTTVVDYPVTATAVAYTDRVAIIGCGTVDYLDDTGTPCALPRVVTVFLMAGVPDTDPGATWDRLDDLLDAADAALMAAGYSPRVGDLLYLDDNRTPAWSLTVEV